MDYYSKYLKYKIKYLKYKNQIGKGENRITIGGEIVNLEKGQKYEITGIISCVGLIVKAYSGTFPSLTFEDGFGVHIVNADGGHFDLIGEEEEISDRELIITDKGNKLFEEIEEKLKGYNEKGLDIEANIITSPMLTPDDDKKPIKFWQVTNKFKEYLKNKLKEFNDKIYIENTNVISKYEIDYL